MEKDKQFLRKINVLYVKDFGFLKKNMKLKFQLKR